MVVLQYAYSVFYQDSVLVLIKHEFRMDVSCCCAELCCCDHD
jgi:hypothetical protein